MGEEQAVQEQVALEEAGEEEGPGEGQAEPAPEPGAPPAELAPAGAQAAATPDEAGAALDSLAPFVRSDRKVGRNEPCPCGSGRKFKHCHGALAGNQ